MMCYRSIDQFVVAKKLGGGYASTVHLAICKATGTQVAIKVYHRCKLSQLNNYQVHREIRIHSCLDHKNVLQLVRMHRSNLGRSSDPETQPLLGSSKSRSRGCGSECLALQRAARDSITSRAKQYRAAGALDRSQRRHSQQSQQLVKQKP
jgi:serine/threonine protein kinase